MIEASNNKEMMKTDVWVNEIKSDPEKLLIDNNKVKLPSSY